MAEVAPEKSRGLKFAEQQLLRHGWEHGKGLGRAENGISEAIKVKVKCDKGGVGHKEGEQFSFHWWDHVFNKASASLQVESDQNGIKLKKTKEDDDEGDGLISNKKPRKAALAKAKLYGCFVKSATLLSGQEQPEPKSSSDSSSSDEEEEQRMDLSSTTKLSDADLMKVCGGRTAHKGARHGLTMSAKLARLEQQEADFMAKYGKKSQPQRSQPVCLAPSSQSGQQQQQEEEEEEVEEEVADVADGRRKKKKKKKRSAESLELNGDHKSECPETELQPKKKKRKRKRADEAEGGQVCAADAEDEDCDQTKRGRITELNGQPRSPAEETQELHVHTKVKKKKKKKLSEPAEEEDGDHEEAHTDPGDADVSMATEKQKRKKSKKDKVTMDNRINEDVLPPLKKKKKKKKQTEN